MRVASSRNSFILQYQCNLCGHMFCNNCSVKVLRSSLGATCEWCCLWKSDLSDLSVSLTAAPAAYTENVRVCLECKNNL